MPAPGQPERALPLVGDTRVYELRLARQLMAFLVSGLIFLLGPGSFLGLWNLMAISQRQAALAVSPAWLQAHGHAEVFGWVGSFILGIGFHSLTRQNQARVNLTWAWACWALWTAGVSLRWLAGVAAWHWRVMLPLAGGLELAAFAIFHRTVRGAHRRAPGAPREPLPGWILLVLTGVCGFLLTLVLHFGADVYLAGWGSAPLVGPGWDVRLVTIMTWTFLVPFVLGFSTRWFPIFAGLRPAPAWAPRRLAACVAAGAVLTIAGAAAAAALCWMALALIAVWALGVVRPSVQPPKTQGIHPSFPYFLRIAYCWLAVAAALNLWAALAPAATGAAGAGRHALTVGFIAGMILTIGPRILPAFSGMRTLFSPGLMLAALVLLQAGCTLRVAGEVLAYPGWLPGAWHWLPVSAGVEVAALALFACNLAATLLRPPEHLRRVR